MKPIALAVLLASVAIPAFAQSRPNAQAMVCAEAARKVATYGAVIMETGPVTFDRFVASRAFCTSSETLEPAFAATRDNPSCLVGYRCREVSHINRR